MLRRGISKWDFDIFGCAETNIDWRMVPEEDKLISRTKGWWESLHLSWAYNSTSKPITARLFRGTALFSIDSAAHRVVEKGADTSNLGRWMWTRYRGKNNHTLQVVTAYCPNNPNGPFTVYAQHNVYFHAIGKPQCPRKAFPQDLCQDLNQFLEAGDNIILMLDGNTNMRQGNLKNALEACSLKEAIISKHGNQGPATY